MGAKSPGAGEQGKVMLRERQGLGWSPLNILSGDRIYPLGPKIMYPYKKCIELHIFALLNTNFS